MRRSEYICEINGNCNKKEHHLIKKKACFLRKLLLISIKSELQKSLNCPKLIFWMH